MKKGNLFLRFTVLAIVLILGVTLTFANRGRYNYGLWNSGFRLRDPDTDQLVMWDDSVSLLKFVDHYSGKNLIKTIGINGSGKDFEFAADVDMSEQNIDLGAVLPAGCIVVSVVLECDVTFTDGSAQSLSTDVGITTGTAALLTAANTDSDGDTNVSAAGSSPILAHLTTARNVWINSTPGVNWSTLTGGELSIIIRYDDLGAVRAQKGL